MSDRRPFNRPEKPKQSDEIRDLVGRLYRASDILLGNSSENRAEALARAHWARRQLRQCKLAETGLARQGRQDPAPDGDRLPTGNPAWMLDVIEDLAAAALSSGLKDTRLSLLRAHAVAAEQLRAADLPGTPGPCREAGNSTG